MQRGTPWGETKQLASTYAHSIESVMDMSSGEVIFTVKDTPDFNVDHQLVLGLGSLAVMKQQGSTPLHVNLKQEVEPIRQVVQDKATAAEAFLGDERYKKFITDINKAFEVIGVKPIEITVKQSPSKPINASTEANRQRNFLPELILGE